MRKLLASVALVLFSAAPLVAQSRDSIPCTVTTAPTVTTKSLTVTCHAPASAKGKIAKGDTLTLLTRVVPAPAPAPVPVPPPTPTPPPVVTPPPAPVPVDTAPASVFATPDLINESFEKGWGVTTNWSGDPPPTGVSRDSTQAADGKWSVKRSWVPNPASDVGAQFIVSTGSHDSLFVRFSVKLTAHISSVMKFFRFYNPGFSEPLGGLFLAQDGGGVSGNGLLNVGTDAENGGITTSIGVTEAQLIDGNWHSIEIAYWRLGDPSGFPCMQFWFDGKLAALPDGTPVKYQGAGNKSFWKGGKWCAGERADTSLLGYIELLATLNAGNTSTGSVWFDRFAISSKGRVGP